MSGYSATLRIINSARDTNGNTYYAFQFIDHETGTWICWLDNQNSATSDICHHKASEPGGRFYISSILKWEIELPKKQFKALTKDYPYRKDVLADIHEDIRNAKIRAEKNIPAA